MSGAGPPRDTLGSDAPSPSSLTHIHSRHAIKKYVLANNNINVPSTKAFDVQINKSIKSGADAGDFLQPKGPSGPVKLAKKDSKTKTAAPTKVGWHAPQSVSRGSRRRRWHTRSTRS